MQIRIALASSILGASLVAAVGVIAADQLCETRTPSDQEDSAPGLVRGLSAFPEVGETDAAYLALACEQLHWFVDPSRCASWSPKADLFDPQSPSFMRIVFHAEPEGAAQFSVTSPPDGLSVRYLGDGQFLNGVIWGRYEAPNGESGYLPHTSLARPPTFAGSPPRLETNRRVAAEDSRGS